MSPSRKPLMLSVVTATILVLVASAVSSNGQDSPTQAEEAKKVEQRIQQLEQRLSQVDKNLAEILKASKQPGKMSELEQYQQIRKLKTEEAQSKSKELMRTYYSTVVVSVNKGGKESMMYEGRIKSLEDHLGKVFLTITTTNPPGEEMVSWDTVTGIKKK